MSSQMYIIQSARQAAALFLIAPMTAVSMAPPAPPAIACEMMPPILRSPDCAAAVIAGSSSVTIWPSTPPPIKPEIILPIIPRSKFGDDLPTPTPPSAPVTRLIKICSMLISQPFDKPEDYPAMTMVSSFPSYLDAPFSRHKDLTRRTAIQMWAALGHLGPGSSQVESPAIPPKAEASSGD